MNLKTSYLLSLESSTIYLLRVCFYLKILQYTCRCIQYTQKTVHIQTLAEKYFKIPCAAYNSNSHSLLICSITKFLNFSFMYKQVKPSSFTGEQPPGLCIKPSPVIWEILYFSIDVLTSIGQKSGR